MFDAIETMWFWFKLYYVDGIFLIAAILSYLYLFVSSRDLRMRFLYPIAMIVFCLVNPLLYKVIFSKAIYWRLFWMIPNAVVIAAAVTSLVKRCNKDWMKIAILFVMTLFVVTQGKNVFVHGNFVKVENWVKLPAETLEVCDVIRSIDGEAKAVLPRVLYSDVRQYAPEIEMMYGRNADGFIYWCAPESQYTYWRMEKEAPDYRLIFEQAQLSKCNFVVVELHKPAEQAVAEQYGYSEAARTSAYIVYYNPNI